MEATLTRTDKLYALLLQSSDRSISFRDFVGLIEGFGFEKRRVKGSHQSFAHPDCPRLLVIQPKGKDAKRYQVREFLAMVEEFSLKMQP
jgi:predicted RNA binding protein YcfA (HicA-like mRNA interferase family)